MKTMTPSLQQKRLRMCGVAAGFLLAAAAVGAQSPAPRIQAEITSSQVTPIRGSENALARVATDLGRMQADTRINGITLRFNRSVAQEAVLDALIAAQQNPASPQYHQWLTPDQFAARFGVAQADIDKVQSWLQQQGFTIDSVNRSHTAIRFSGSVAQVESAFATQMRFYQVNGEKHFAPSTALSVPAAMASVVADIHNLDDFRPKAQHIVPRGNFTSAQSGNVFFAPGDIVTTYDIQPLYSRGINGAGQTIAIMGQSQVTVTDIENFESAAGLNKKDPNLVLMPGTGTSTTVAGDESESDLDLEWSGAMAPGANVVFVYTGNSPNYNTYDAADYAVGEGIGNIISMSYSTCELDPGLTSSYVQSQEAIYKQAALQGQTVLAASGDQGSTSCYGDTNVTSTSQQEQLAVNYPASSAYITAVGGTEISSADGINPTTGLPGANFSTYWQSASSTTGPDVTNSALKYIPEVAWNDDSLNASSGSCSSTTPCLSSSGGGASTLIARPSWQTGVPGIASGSMRLLPDIAFYSSPSMPGYLYCTSDTTSWQTGGSGGGPGGTTQAQQASCNSGFRDQATKDLTVAGGTSFATPIFAGMVALLNQSGRYVTGGGLLNTSLYSLAAQSSIYGSAFHDVTSGNNNCNVPANCSGTAGFSAGTGYDEVTGLGSVDLDLLAKSWPANSGSSAALIGTTTAVTAANPTPNIGATDVFTITVSSDSGSTVPSGTVTLQIDGGTSCGEQGVPCGGTTLSNQTLSAAGTFSYTATFTSAGIHSIVAQYSGDATHAASTGVGSASIAIVSSGKGTIATTVTPSTLTVAQGSQGTETITVTPAGGYTGTVLLNVDFGAQDTTLTNLCAYFSSPNTAGEGQVQIGGTQPASGTLILDTNAADCSTGTGTGPGGGSKPAMRPLRDFMNGRIAKNTGRNPAPGPWPLALAGLLLAGFFGRRSRRFRNLVAVLALAVAGMAISACNGYGMGGGGGGYGTVTNPPQGTYTGTITATDSTNPAIAAPAMKFTFVIN